MNFYFILFLGRRNKKIRRIEKIVGILKIVGGLKIKRRGGEIKIRRIKKIRGVKIIGRALTVGGNEKSSKNILKGTTWTSNLINRRFFIFWNRLNLD